MMPRRVIFGFLLLGAALAVPASAQAATAKLSVSPKTTAPGTVVHVSGSCEANTSGSAISTAFLHDASHDFAGVGAAPFSTNASGAFSVDARVSSTIKPGSYGVTARCGGGNLGIEVTLRVSGSAPSGVPAGSGGAAATPGITNSTWWLAGAGVALIAVGAGSLRLRRPAR
jgi:hypothetical protein